MISPDTASHSYFILNHSQTTPPPLRHFIRFSSFITLSVLVTKTLTSMALTKTVSFITIAYLTSHLTASIFAAFLEPYSLTPLVPIIGQVVHLSLAILIAQKACSLIKSPLSFHEVKVILACAAVAIAIFKMIIRRWHMAY